MSHKDYCLNPTEKSFLSNSTKFTLCVYWEKKPDGTFYSAWDIEQKKHRKYIDSYDYHLTKEHKSVVRHDEAFYKLLVYAQRNIKNAFKAIIYLNDFGGEKQYTICKLSKDELQCQIVIPSFTNADDNPLGHVYADGLNGLPLATSDLIQRVLTKKPIQLKQVA